MLIYTACTYIVAGLKFLVRLCTDLGLKDAQEYIQKLKKAEKARETKQQVHIIAYWLIIIE